MVATSRYQCDCNTMGFHCFLVLAAVIQVIVCQGFGEGPPGPQHQGFNHKCARPPPNVKNPQDCCVIEPMYSEAELTECGFKKLDEGSRPQGPPQPPDCSKPECLLQKRDLMNDDKTIKYDEMKTHMEEWVKSHQEFKEAVNSAKSICMGEGGPPGPPHICEANKLMFCTAAVMFHECPTWKDSDECKQFKEHMDECKSFNFPPPK